MPIDESIAVEEQSRTSADPIRVLFMQSQTFFGGDYRIHARLMEAWDRRPILVHVACNQGDGQTPALDAMRQIPRISIRSQSFGPSLYQITPSRLAKQLVTSGVPGLVGFGGLLRYAHRRRIDVVHCTDRPRDAFYGLLLARATRAQCVIHLHHKAEDWIPSTAQWSMRHADALICVSSFVADSAVAMGFGGDRIFVAKNGIDVTAWDPSVDGSELRRELGLPADRPLVSIIGRVCYWKGHLALLEALSRIRDRTDFHLLVVGEDDPSAAPGRPGLTADLRARAGELGIRDRVTFTGFRADVRDVLAASDVYAMPTHEEAFGMVFLESMAMEVPAVAYASGGVPEVVQHGTTGLLAPEGDVEALSRHLLLLLEDADLRHRMGLAGRRRAEREFTLAGMAYDVEQIYHRIVGR